MLETLKRRQPRGVMGERFLANDLMGKPAGIPRLPDIARLQTSEEGCMILCERGSRDK